MASSDTPQPGVTLSAGPQLARRLEALMGAYSGLTRHATGLVALQVGIEALEARPSSAGPYLPPYARHVAGRRLLADEDIEVEVEQDSSVSNDEVQS